MKRDDLLKAIASGDVQNIPEINGLTPILGIKKIKAKTSETVRIASPGNFHPRCVYMVGATDIGSDAYRRFTVGSIRVGHHSQLSVDTEPNGTAETGELLSDVFNRSDEPLAVNWQTVDADGLKVRAFNVNDEDVYVFVCIWGEPQKVAASA